MHYFNTAFLNYLVVPNGTELRHLLECVFFLNDEEYVGNAEK